MVTCKPLPSTYSSRTSMLNDPHLPLLVFCFVEFFSLPTITLKNPYLQLFMAQPESSAWGCFLISTHPPLSTPTQCLSLNPSKTQVTHKDTHTRTHKHSHTISVITIQTPPSSLLSPFLSVCVGLACDGGTGVFSSSPPCLLTDADQTGACPH